MKTPQKTPGKGTSAVNKKTPAKVSTPAQIKKVNPAQSPINKKKGKFGFPKNGKPQKVVAPSNDNHDSGSTAQLQTLQVLLNISGNKKCYKEPILTVLKAIQCGRVDIVRNNYICIVYNTESECKSDEERLKKIKSTKLSVETTVEVRTVDKKVRTIFVGHKDLKKSIQNVKDVSKAEEVVPMGGAGLLKVSFASVEAANEADVLTFQTNFGPKYLQDFKITPEALKRKLKTDSAPTKVNKTEQANKKQKVEVKPEESEEEDDEDDDENDDSEGGVEEGGDDDDDNEDDEDDDDNDDDDDDDDDEDEE